MNTLTIILIVLAIVLLIANIVMFVMEHTKKNELSFDKSKVKIMLFASEDEDEIIKEEIKMFKKYYTLDSAIGSLETEHGYIYIKAYLMERK